jgi:hypothetical protein
MRPVLILRSDAQRRVSKDGRVHGCRFGPWFETPCFARLLTMRMELR